MGAPGTSADTRLDDAAPGPDSSWRGVYRVGGIAMMASGVAVLAGTTLGYRLGVPPGDSLEYLRSLAAQPVVANAAYWLWSIYGVLLIPAALGLYLALKGVNKNAALLGAALTSFFVALDLGITEFNSLALVRLAQDSAAATRDAQRQVYLTAAHWGLATMPVASFFSWVGPSAGFLILSVVMLKSVFGRGTAVLGIAANGAGIAAGFYFLFPISSLGILLTLVLLAYGVWLIAAGRRLYALRRIPDAV